MKYLVLLIVMSLIIGGCIFDPEEDVITSVKYEITGSAGKVNITYENSGGNTSQLSDVPLPWTYSFNVKEGNYTFLYVSAQNQGNTGSVTTKIYFDSKVAETSTSSGAYVIATASTSIE